MKKFFEKLNISLNKDTVFRFILFLIPLFSIVLKGILFQCFVSSKNPYELDFHLGFLNANNFLDYYYAFTLIFLSFSLLFKGKGRVIYLFVVDAILTALILTDITYFRGFLTVPSVLILTQTANLDNMSGSIFSMFSNYDFLFLIDFVVLGIYVFFTRKSYVRVQKRAIKSFLLTLILPIIFILYVPFNLYVLGNKDVKNAYLFDNYDPTNTVKYFSSVGYHIIDAINVYKDSKPYKLTEEDKTQINDYYNFKNENLPNNKYYGMYKGKNLIVIQVESLESFVLGQTVNGKKLTPVMDKLIKDGMYFPNICEQVNEGTSSDSDLMINTSMLPLRRGSTFFRYPNRAYNSMPLILGNEGYTSEAIHPDKGSFWNYKNGLTAIGFNKFTDFYSFNPDEIIGMGLSDKTYFRQVVPMLEKLKQPFYAFTVTLTNHGPFDLPKSMRKLNLDPELDKSELGGYLESVHYTDAQIGYFLSLLDKAGILNNTVIAIEGDHTGVHKYYQHSIDNLSHKEAWYSNNGIPTIPLIVYNKDKTVGKTFDTIGGQIDIMPTLLYTLGIPSNKYQDTALGRNLLNTNRDYAVLTNGKIIGNTKDLSKKQLELIEGSLEMSDKMIRADYFNMSKN
ncbi:LTA synthase family protein [Clostridium sp. Ade.TY]|uniref:LTA synthase family protein n=1 Tax=Clostridium sp. Ade.TY TaxID=1391647 RepID=UPI000401DF50|nr:LTA synthase family protein [Clostridium sp. Ade.TY]